MKQEILNAEVLTKALQEGAEALTEIYRHDPARRPAIGRHAQTIWLKQKGAANYLPFEALFQWDGVFCTPYQLETQASVLARALQAQFN
jgi:hypothetical protein